jgi:hypothetical protein
MLVKGIKYFTHSYVRTSMTQNIFRNNHNAKVLGGGRQGWLSWLQTAKVEYDCFKLLSFKNTVVLKFVFCLDWV